MKILHLIDHMNEGGAQKIVYFFLNNPNGNIVKAYSLKPAKSENLNLKSSNSNAPFSIRKLWDVKNYIHQFEPEIVQVHLNNATLFCFFFIFIFQIKTKWIIHEHGEIFRTDFMGWALRFLYRQVKNKVKFMAVSEAVSKEILSKGFGNSNNNKVLKNIPFSETTSVKKEVTDKFTIAFVGRIAKRKNWTDFLQIATHFISDETVDFKTYGSGPDEFKLHKQINKLALNKKVEHINWIESMDSAYAKIDCVLLLSEWEGFSLVQLESLKKGIPVIAYNNKGMNELGGELGVIQVNNKNINGVVSIINKLHGNKSFYLKNQTAAKELVLSFSRKGYLERLQNIYSSI